MTNTRKILGVVLAVVMALSCLTVAFAADTDVASVAVASSATELKAGESATITVKVSANFAAATVSVPVFYDKTLVDVSEVTAGTLAGGTVNTATDKTSASANQVYKNTGVDSTQYGFVLANFIASAGQSVAATLDGAVVVTFKVTAKQDVTGDAVIKVVEGSKKTTSNTTGMLYFGKISSTTVNEIAKNVENVTLDGAVATIKIGSAEPNTLKIKDSYANSGIIIDKEITGMIANEEWYPHLVGATDSTATGMIYGLDTIGYDDNFESDTYLTLEDVLTTTYGDSYLRVTAPEAADGFQTTGTVVEVLDKDNKVIETYYFVYFGDVNGDGFIDSSDATASKTFDFYSDTTKTVAATMAIDYNGDSFMDATDATIIASVDFNQNGFQKQATVAESFYSAAHGE